MSENGELKPDRGWLQEKMHELRTGNPNFPGPSLVRRARDNEKVRFAGVILDDEIEEKILKGLISKASLCLRVEEMEPFEYQERSINFSRESEQESYH